MFNHIVLPMLDSENTVSSTGKSADAVSKAGQVKRPMNSFMVWGKERRKILRAQNPRIPNSVISRALGAEWNSKSNEEKAVYVKMAKDLQEKHKRENPDYKFKPKRKPKNVESKKKQNDCRANATCPPSRIMTNTISYFGSFPQNTNCASISTSSSNSFKSPVCCHATQSSSVTSPVNQIPSWYTNSQYYSSYQPAPFSPETRFPNSKYWGNYSPYIGGPNETSTAPSTYPNPQLTFSSPHVNSLPSAYEYANPQLVFPTPQIPLMPSSYTTCQPVLASSQISPTNSSPPTGDQFPSMLQPSPPVQPLSNLQQSGDIYDSNLFDLCDDVFYNTLSSLFT